MTDTDDQKHTQENTNNANNNSGGTNNVLSKRARMLLEREPQRSQSHADSMQVIFQRSIAAILGSKEVNSTNEAYEYICMLAEEHLIELCTKLHKVSSVQRRHSPAVTDIAMLLRYAGIRIHDLESQKDLNSRYVDALNQLKFDPTEEPVSEQARPFFDTSSTKSLDKLVPSRKKQGSHIPSWMPPFPPDHTFMATPQYTKRVTDPRQLREKIVQEGRLAEQALRRVTETTRVGDESLIEEEDDEDVEMNDFKEENEDEDLVEVELDDENNNNNNNVTTTNDNEKEQKGKEDEEDEPPPVMSLPSFNVNTTTAPSLDDSAAVSPTTEINETQSELQDEEEDEPPQKKISLKISLGGSVVKATPSDAGTATMSASDRNKLDPFGVKTTSKRFDVVEYAKKRQSINERREKKKLEAQAEVEASEQNKNNQTTLTTGADLIDHEFNAAFSSVQKKNDQNSEKGVKDSGVINWDRKRYTYN